jgi:hypothetical protein
MRTDLDNLDLFCRVNIQSESPHKEFIAFIARTVSGASRLNSVTSDKLDISVDDNDSFDAEKARRGEDRWLYFRYSLEIDPIEGASRNDYVAAIADLIQSLWSSDMDAVASCEFEDRLPQNVRRLKWALHPRSNGTVDGGTEIIGRGSCADSTNATTPVRSRVDS